MFEYVSSIGFPLFASSNVSAPAIVGFGRCRSQSKSTTAMNMEIVIAVITSILDTSMLAVMTIDS
jgi:hypothetical protein